MSYLLKLIALQCIDENEYLGDEPVINVNNQRVFKGDWNEFKTSYIEAFNDGNGIIVPFQNTANINIFENDLGYWPDQHDYIDSHTIYGASYVGAGPQTIDFIGGDAHYQLTFSVGVDF